MSSILIASGIVAAIGLLAGLILSVASVVMAVPVDEKAEAIEELLPGANCGACGYSGCSGYAAAISKGEASLGRCAPGGRETASKIAEIMAGGEVAMEYNVAVVKCLGSNDNTSDKMIYDGLESCVAAMQLSGGKSSCSFGCLGFGDCVKACTRDAIEICNGVAHVNYDLCSGCGQCEKACPRNIIDIVPKRKHVILRCSSCDKGAVTNKICKAGCIGCGKCMKACEYGAIKVVNNKAEVNLAFCVGCGKCVDACPKGCLMTMDF